MPNNLYRLAEIFVAIVAVTSAIIGDVKGAILAAIIGVWIELARIRKTITKEED